MCICLFINTKQLAKVSAVIRMPPTTCSYVFFASTSLSTWVQGVNNTARLEFMADDNRIMGLTDVQCYYAVSVQSNECLELPYLDTYVNCPGLI